MPVLIMDIGEVVSIPCGPFEFGIDKAFVCTYVPLVLGRAGARLRRNRSRSGGREGMKIPSYVSTEKFCSFVGEFWGKEIFYCGDSATVVVGSWWLEDFALLHL